MLSYKDLRTKNSSDGIPKKIIEQTTSEDDSLVSSESFQQLMQV